MKNRELRSKTREAGLETVEWVVMLVLIVLVAAGGFALLRGPILDRIGDTTDCINKGTCTGSAQTYVPAAANPLL